LSKQFGSKVPSGVTSRVIFDPVATPLDYKYNFHNNAKMTRFRISSRQIEAFVSVAQCKSFTAAAHSLDISTSAISNLIAELESIVHVRLFERSTRKVVLNDAGRLLLPVALAFCRELASLELVAEGLAAQSVRKIRIAAPMVMASSILPEMIAQFQISNPETEIELVETGVEWLGERVAQGETDLAVGPDRATDDTVIAEELMPTRWVAWLCPDHQLARKDILLWRDLKGVRFFTGGHDHERVFEQAMAGLAQEDQMVPGQVFDNISTALGVAGANLGVALCPEYVAPMARAFNLVPKRVIDPEFTRFVTLYSSAIRPRSEATLALIHHLKECFAGLSRPLAGL
jgi:DNA-binding transcriptional LysR family regulator